MKKLFFNIRAAITGLLSITCFVCLINTQVALGEKWSGVDKTVIERYAKQAGHAPRTSLINIDGDLLLFLFLLAGLIGGFVIGYYWRAIFKSRSQE